MKICFQVYLNLKGKQTDLLIKGAPLIITHFFKKLNLRTCQSVVSKLFLGPKGRNVTALVERSEARELSKTSQESCRDDILLIMPSLQDSKHGFVQNPWPRYRSTRAVTLRPFGPLEFGPFIISLCRNCLNKISPR